ncbi:MAG: glycosyltransferase [Gemmataceae bacterium]
MPVQVERLHQENARRSTTDVDGQAPQLLERRAVGYRSQDRVRTDGLGFARANARFRIQGVTYGPFAPDENGTPFPSIARVADDFAGMCEAGINAIRTYHVPPEWMLELASEREISVLVDVPWAKHLCFLEGEDTRRQARDAVRDAALLGRKHASVLGYSLCNEIPADIVRWYGRMQVEKFLYELWDVAKQADPEGLTTYANFPPTEYLNVSFLDFLTFNVYLHDPRTFRKYLMRLGNIAGDKPVVLGELGMDALRHGENAQAEFLQSHLADIARSGLAGAFVFSWTDDWHTGGHAIQDWAFGVTRADRSPRAAYHAAREVFTRSPASLLPSAPRVSVIVCTYNGGRTLRQCLHSLLDIEYPDYEVIVVDDGSTDDTQEILRAFPDVRVIRQENCGLSAARNTGLNAASGSIVAYTDSDCYADRHWLTGLVDQLERSGASAVGGPNLSPEDGQLAACIGASPGQPMHVLESDQVAEHIPGCNMACRKEALVSINGFDPLYRVAGDDVDVCWRLQQAGHWITFAPGAFVWHHRRQTLRGYFRQQAGYGNAEALLRFKHPARFNSRGDGKWRGVVYGASLQGLRLEGPIIYQGIFGTGLFQCIYQPGPAHWAMLPSTLEWHAVALMIAAMQIYWSGAFAIAAAMLVLSAVIAGLQASQAKLAPGHRGVWSRLLVAGLCYAQPLVRSWARYRTRLTAYRAPVACPSLPKNPRRGLTLSGRRTDSFWSETGVTRTQVLANAVDYLNEHCWGKTIDSGWERWDLEVHCHPWTILQIQTVQENHGGSRRLIRVSYRLRPARSIKLLSLLGLSAVIGGAIWSWPACLLGAGCLMLCAGAWWRGTQRAAEAVAVIDGAAQQLHLIPNPHSGRDA